MSFYGLCYALHVADRKLLVDCVLSLNVILHVACCTSHVVRSMLHPPYCISHTVMYILQLSSPSSSDVGLSMVILEEP